MAKRGDILTDFVTAPWYNEVTKKLGIKTGGGLLADPVRVTVYNHNTTAHKIWEPVSLGSAKIDYTDYPNVPYNEIAFVTKTLTSSDEHNIAILQEPLEGIVDASAQALIVGASWLRMPEALSSDSFVHISSSNVLEYNTSGRIEVLRDFEIDTGVEWLALALIGSLGSSDAIVDIRVSGLNLQYTKNNTDWTTWHTGETCSS